MKQKTLNTITDAIITLNTNGDRAPVQTLANTLKASPNRILSAFGESISLDPSLNPTERLAATLDTFADLAKANGVTDYTIGVIIGLPTTPEALAAYKAAAAEAPAKQEKKPSKKPTSKKAPAKQEKKPAKKPTSKKAPAKQEGKTNKAQA